MWFNAPSTTFCTSEGVTTPLQSTVNLLPSIAYSLSFREACNVVDEGWVNQGVGRLLWQVEREGAAYDVVVMAGWATPIGRGRCMHCEKKWQKICCQKGADGRTYHHARGSQKCKVH
eukprot:4702970-Amphidinium_carterae.1